MNDRLTSGDWIDFGLRTLARGGFDALKADVLARKLGVSRGSFYWHFADLGAFHAAVIENWRQTATEAIIADLERCQTPEDRLEVLLRRAFGHSAVLEIRMRSWAESNSFAAKAVRDVDRRRREYIERLLDDAGIEQPAAAGRAQILYWTYLGAALSGSKLAGQQLDQMVAELKLLALGRSPYKAAAASRAP